MRARAAPREATDEEGVPGEGAADQGAGEEAKAREQGKGSSREEEEEARARAGEGGQAELQYNTIQHNTIQYNVGGQSPSGSEIPFAKILKLGTRIWISGGAHRAKMCVSKLFQENPFLRPGLKLANASEDALLKFFAHA